MKKIIIAIFALCLLNSCDRDSLDVSSDEFKSSEMKRANPKTEGVTVPFKSDFFTEQIGEIDYPACGDDDAGINTQEGHGEATHLGRLFTHMEFCHDFTFMGPDSTHPDPEYRDKLYWEYNGGTGYFLAANGDKLEFEMAGRVYIFIFDPVNSEFDLRWDDPFIFTGGTGRFVGASGGGTTNSYTDDGDINHHSWTGTLTLLKGK